MTGREGADPPGRDETRPDRAEKKDVLRPVDDDARAAAKTLIRTARFAALGALQGDWPAVSRVGLATDVDGAPIFPASTLTPHTAAMAADPRVSLLIGAPGKGDPLAHPRLTLFARAERLARGGAAHERARRRYLARHPKAALYIDFGDFAMVRAAPERAAFNGGFGKAYEMRAADLRAEGDVAALAPLEAEAVAHMNEDHADAVALYAVRLAGAAEGAWRCVGIDPEGIDLAAGDAAARVAFPRPLESAEQLRPALVALAKRARA